MPGQTIRTVTDDGEYNNLDTIQSLGWCLLSYDKARIRRIMQALESADMSMSRFIAEAVETYAFTIEHAFCFPELTESLTARKGCDP